MKKALIDPQGTAEAITSWEKVDGFWTPVYTVIANSWRVAEVADAEFPVAPPLFWEACEDNVIADKWYYDSVQLVILQVPAPVPLPVEAQPQVSGAQTL